MKPPAQTLHPVITSEGYTKSLDFVPLKKTVAISLGLWPTRWCPALAAVSGTDQSRREKMCLVVLIVPGHSQIGMLLV